MTEQDSAASVILSLQEFKFSCGHFIAYPGFREKLHGHNYSLEIDISGVVSDTDGYVIDFGVVKDTARKLCKELNERMLVPTLSESLKITIGQPVVPQVIAVDLLKHCDNVHIVTEFGNYFSFPLEDCALLPIRFTSAEEIACYLWNRINTDLCELFSTRTLTQMTVRVLERPGQCAKFTKSFSSCQ